MELLSKNHDGATLKLTTAELVILNNALNEVLNGMETEEFNVRIGTQMEEAERLLKAVGSILEDEQNRKA